MLAGICVPGDVAGLSASAAHLRSAGVKKTGLFGLHCGELRKGTGPSVPRCGNRGGRAVGWATGSFEQLRFERALLWFDLSVKRNRTE